MNWRESMQLIAQPDDLSDIYVWISMSIIYFDTQMTEKYSTAMCQDRNTSDLSYANAIVR